MEEQHIQVFANAHQALEALGAQVLMEAGQCGMPLNDLLPLLKYIADGSRHAQAHVDAAKKKREILESLARQSSGQQ